jgi:hypothetical protein
MRNTPLLCRCAVFLAALFVLAGCAPIPLPDGRGDPVGRISRVTGPDVFLSGRHARDGETVFSGDNVTCGPGSRADVVLPDGGKIEIAENTDPDFRKWFASGKCFIQVFFRYGRAYGTTGDACDIVLNTDHLEAVAHTEFHVEVTGGRTILTVYRGEMVVERPRHLTIGPGSQAVVSRSGVDEVRKLNPGELERIILWRSGGPSPQDYSGWCCANDRVFETTEDKCRRSKGFFSVREEEVRDKCRRREPEPERGWCCANDRVFETTEDKCRRSKGFFSVREEEVRDKCRRREPEPESGWCCANDRVFETTEDKCRRSKGFFSVREEEVRERCKSGILRDPGVLPRDMELRRSPSPVIR